MTDNLPPPFDVMLDNYQLARGSLPSEHKSNHWNVFPDDYEKAIMEYEAWPILLRNGLSVGFNDDFVSFCPGGDLSSDGGEESLWPYRQKHDYRPLLPAILDQPEQIEKIAGVFKWVIDICGIEFVLANLIPDTGSPAMAQLEVKIAKAEPPRLIGVNLHDLVLIYYAWQIYRVSRPILPKRPIIAEIGGGFGSGIAKLKDLFPDAVCLIFDLPEVNAVQTYYIKQRFPEARIELIGDVEGREELLPQDCDADFLILPGWLIDRLQPKSLDLVVNQRSMMEMNPIVVAFYFEHLQRALKEDGLFACANRYEKGDQHLRFKNYPFDRNWRMLLSQSSRLQPHIHEIIVQRTQEPQSFPVSDALCSLP